MELPIIVQHKHITLKLFDYMNYPKGQPARNIEAYDDNGNRLWTIAALGGNPRTDCYTNIKSQYGRIHAFNFQCFDCIIDETDGSIISKSFTK